ncbi:MAG: flagellar filament capping protein FliD [Actinomycetota bacterium]|nr:flagellar filament capping protein FliD [Actinomycetota bacterium]
MGTGSVDGLISGLQSGAIVDQMMQLEAMGQSALYRKVSTHKTVLSAYQGVNGKMSSLLTAAAALTGATSWQAVKATSSAESVKVSASTGATSGALTLDVTALAKSASRTYSPVDQGTTTLAGETVTITKDGKSVVVTPSDRGVVGVASAINGANAGVNAMAVQVAPGRYQLQLTSTTTGTKSNFTVDGLSAAMTVENTAAGADAAVTIGSSTVTSATNTFGGVVPGVTFTVSKLESAVRLDLKPDGESVADKAQALVDAANAVLSEVKKHSSYDAGSKRGGPLLSDGTVRSLQQQIISTINHAIPGAGSPKDAGIELSKDGKLTFDRTAFLTKYSSEPGTLQRLYGSSGSFSVTGTTGTVSLLTATDRTQEKVGGYAVQITQAATRTEGSVDLTNLTLAQATGGASVTVKAAGKTVTYTATGTDDAATFRAGLAKALEEAKVGVVVEGTGSTATIRSTAYGADSGFTLTATGVGTGAVTLGKDVVGTIDGVAGTGRGQTLTLAVDAQTPARGMSLNVTLTAADVSNPVSGTFDFRAGVAQRLANTAKSATDVVDGTLTRTIAGRNSNIEDLNKQIESWDRRLELRRKNLQKQFSGLEVTLGKLRNQSNWLAGAVAGLPSYQ